MADFLSVAQLTGYLAFALGVIAFLQHGDRRLRAMIGLQASSYALHFTLLGSRAAMFASLVTASRAFISLYTRAPWVGVAILFVNVTLGVFTTHGAGLGAWLPVTAASLGTIAFFWFEGIPMRLILLGSTACWLTNNLLLGSIGGTLLELFIGGTNTVTCVRLWRMARERRDPAG